jgi:hypothetical protein
VNKVSYLLTNALQAYLLATIDEIAIIASLVYPLTDLIAQ